MHDLKYLRQDPIMADLIAKFGPLNYPPQTDLFTSLASSIIGQQLSNKAADTIWRRFLTLFPGQVVTPSAILALPLDTLRSIGTSYAKANSLHDLSHKALDGTLQLDRLPTLTDDEVIQHLIQVKGIGVWTAQMRLMFSLSRPDVFPLQDVGIQNAVVKLYGLNRRHKSFPAKLIRLSNRWRPYRTLACFYLWASLDNTPK